MFPLASMQVGSLLRPGGVPLMSNTTHKQGEGPILKHQPTPQGPLEARRWSDPRPPGVAPRRRLGFPGPAWPIAEDCLPTSLQLEINCLDDRRQPLQLVADQLLESGRGRVGDRLHSLDAIGIAQC